MKLGAVAAQKRLQELFRADVKGKSMFRRLFTQQIKDYERRYDRKSDVMYNYLALELRYGYLELRSQGIDHNEPSPIFKKDTGSKS